MKLTIIILLAASTVIAQSFTVENISGTVKYQYNGSDKWIELGKDMQISDDAIISTEENSSVQLGNGNITFNMGELSAVSISSIKEMSIDDLLLALALEDVINAPKDTDESSENTAVYGTRESETNSIKIKSNDFGIKRLNGAVQLSEMGFKESAVVVAKETFRKYPATKILPGYRIYFANILNDKGLYEEALEEYKSISELNLTETQNLEIEQKSELIRKKLLSE